VEARCCGVASRMFSIFSPARPPVTSEPQLIVTDTSGKTVYSTLIDRYTVLGVACQRETP
jgi:hypothetical protein